MAQTQGHRPAKKIGLIGGLALRAGIFYYERLVRALEAQHATPRVMLNHADIGTVLGLVGAGDRVALGGYLGAVANELFAGGAGLVAVTAVAPHMAIGEMMRVARGPVVDVLGLAAGGLARSGLRRVAVFGNRAVMDSGVFGAVTPEAVVRLDAAETDRVHAAYSDVALSGKRGTQPEMSLFGDVARALISRGAQAILLAGTDLSSFYADAAPDYPCVDLAQLHIDEIIRLALAE